MTRSDTGPFSLVPVWVLDLDISALAIRVYAIHSDFADRNGAHQHSRKAIAARAGCSLDALDRAHGELVKAGALRINHRRDDTSPRQTSNRYEVKRVIHNPAAQMRLGSRVGAAGGGRVDAAGGPPVGGALTRISNEPRNVVLPPPLNAVEKAHGRAQAKQLSAQVKQLKKCTTAAKEESTG